MFFPSVVYSRVTNLSALFDEHPNFNEDISGWDVSKATDMSYMFYGATLFNSDLSGWNVLNVTNTTNYASGATAWTPTSRHPPFDKIFEISVDPDINIYHALFSNQPN